MLATSLMSIALVGSTLLVIDRARGDVSLELTLWRWMPGTYLGGFDVPLAIYLDQLSGLMCLVITGVGLIVHLYSLEYMRYDAKCAQFFATLSSFVFTMLVVVLSNNYFVMFLGSAGVTLSCRLLTVFWETRGRDDTLVARAFIISRIGDVGFITATFLIFSSFGTLNMFGNKGNFSVSIDGVFVNIANTEKGVLTTITLLLFVSAASKGALVPLHIWLPEAMRAPPPACALILSAAPVVTGVYMLWRSWPLFLTVRGLEFAPTATGVLVTIFVVGILTMVVGLSTSLAQTDLKLALAYESVGQFGYAFCMIALGVPTRSLAYLILRTVFTAVMILWPEWIIKAALEGEGIGAARNPARHIPITMWAMFVGSGALTGNPPTGNFFSSSMGE